MSVRWAQLRRIIRARVSTSPAIYLPLRQLFTSAIGVVHEDTELLIEGYPRSGNSFAEAAFRLAQPEPVGLAHHTHAAAQVLAAAKWNVPTLLLIREPLDAARSLMMHHPALFTPAKCLKEYIVFHEAILPIRSKYLLARFETVTRDFGQVMVALNATFGTQFEIFEHSKENEKAAFALLNQLSRERGTVTDEGEPYSPDRDDAFRTSREREKQRVRAAFEHPKLDQLRRRAEASYRRMLESSGAIV
ncbi:MAG: hypothetical protein SFU85_09935 [Candidatus Methylacidiphilales bacterium]|nr:hypothetical protein [Candidatus Methylacidiphilales bacterium]